MKVPGSALESSVRQRLAAVKLAVFDFDGVFTDNRVWVFEDGSEAVACSRADGMGLQALRDAGVLTFVLSTETNVVVARRCEKLRIDCIHGCPDKLPELQKLAERHGLTADMVAYVGNDVNDARCLEWAGVPITVRDAHPAVAGMGLYQTCARGGRGAVREICDLIVALKTGRKSPTCQETFSASGTESSS